MNDPIEKWRRGVPLSSAYLHFAPLRLHNGLERAERQPARRRKNVKPPEFNVSTLSEISKYISDPLMEHLKDLSRIAGIYDEMKNLLLNRLISGGLGAYGFSVENGIAAEQPRKIPPLLFNIKFAYWGRSSLKGLGHEFVNVRIVRENYAKPTSIPVKPQSVPVIAPRRRIGRPSIKDVIREAIISLYEQGIDLGSFGSIEVGKLVRDRISGRLKIPTSEISGASDETIRRIHREYRRQLKSK